MEAGFKFEELSREEITLFVIHIFQRGRACQADYPLQKNAEIERSVSSNEESIFVGANGESISNNEIISLLFTSGMEYEVKNPVFCKAHFNQQIAELSSKIGSCVFKKFADPDPVPGVVYTEHDCPLNLGCSSNQEDKLHAKIVNGGYVCFACGAQSWYQCN